MLNLQGEDIARFKEAMEMLARSEHGRVFLGALEKDLKVLDAKNRVVGEENKVGAALYLGRLFERAYEAGYRPAGPIVVESHYEDSDNGRQGIWAAIKATVRRVLRPGSAEITDKRKK